ncbi:MAG: PAS domain S-box protein, partial [Candidatus Hydrothermarchaeales archaeon]
WEASKDLRMYNEEEAENVIRLLATISSMLSRQASYAAKLREYSEQLEEKVKRRTEELRETKDFLSSIVNGSADSIITTNLEGKITTWSRGAEEIFGYKAEDMIGRPIDELYPPELKETRKRWQKRIMKGETIRNQRTKVYNSDGELVDINLTLSPLRDKDGRPMGTVGIAKDIKQVIKLEQEIIEAKNMAEFFNDLMTHDINNANTVAIGILEELKDSLALDEEQEKLFDKSLYAIRRSSRLIDSVKMLQQVREVGEESFRTRDLVPVLEEVIHDAILLHRDKYVRINYTPKETLIYTDDLVKDLFLNLVDNAIKYDRSNKVIVDVSVEDLGENWKIGIEDRGRGVPEEMKEAIFNRYERIDEGLKGSGIGLHLVKVLVERYGGKTWVEDRVKGDHKKGSIFYVTLPRGDAAKPND